MTGRLRPPAPPEDPAVVGTRTLSGARVHVDVVVPRTSIRGSMRLLSRAELATVKAGLRRHFGELGMPITPVDLAAAGHLEEWNNEMGARLLAVAVRDPSDVETPLALLEEWRECDDDQLAPLWRRYQDELDRLDPLGDTELDEADRAAIEAAVKKKDADRLMLFGSRKLALYATTTVAPPAS